MQQQRNIAVMTVSVGDQQALGFQRLQRMGVARCQQTARQNAVSRRGPIIHRADVLRGVHQQQHHTNASWRICRARPQRIFQIKASRGANRAFSFEEQAAPLRR